MGGWVNPTLYNDSIKEVSAMSGIKGMPNRPNVVESCLTGTDAEKAEIISNTIQINLIFRELGKTRPKNTTELINRIDEFFYKCNQYKTFPTVEKMCLSIGFSRQLCWDWITGRTHCTMIAQIPGDPTVPDILTSAKDFISSNDADLVSAGKIPVVSYIFRSKQFYGFVDKQEVVVQPQDNNIKPSMSMEEIAASMPVPELLPGE